MGDGRSSREVKITFAEMRDDGVRGILVYSTGTTVAASMALMADRWPGEMTLSDIESRFVCLVCGKCGADVRPNSNWNIQGPIGGMGYR